MGRGDWRVTQCIAKQAQGWRLSSEPFILRVGRLPWVRFAVRFRNPPPFLRALTGARLEKPHPIAVLADAFIRYLPIFYIPRTCW
jgi:hypothetical protein